MSKIYINNDTESVFSDTTNITARTNSTATSKCNSESNSTFASTASKSTIDSITNNSIIAKTIDTMATIDTRKNDIMNAREDINKPNKPQLQSEDSNTFYSKNTNFSHIDNTINTTNTTNTINTNKLRSLENKINIDVAVLCQEYTAIEKMCNDHVINLDEIEITKDVFQAIFYPYCVNFGLDKNNLVNNKQLMPYISFLPEYRTLNGKSFYLLEQLISNIESDLNVSRNYFTRESLVELSNEIISLYSLCDLNYCSVLASLTWTNILEIIKNYTLVNISDCNCGTNDNSTNPIIPICVISIIFKTPTPGVKNTIIRFNYRLTNL